MIVDGALAELPTTRDEAWKYTPVGEIVERMQAATPATRGRHTPVLRATVDALAGDHGGRRMVFVDGAYDAALSDDDHPDRRDQGGQDMAVVEVDPGTHTRLPVHIVHLATPDGLEATQATISHPRTTIAVGDGAQVTIIETYCGLDGPTVTDASTTIEVGRDAELDLYRIQQESSQAVHVGDTRIRQAAGSRVRVTAVTTGGDIARNAIAVDLAEPGAETDLAGVQVTTGRQRHDTVVTVDHAVERCSSTQRFGAIVDDHARSSFSGEIVVRPGADGTDAHQSSRNLVLSPDAEADTRPWLQILADDVRCTHGATVGRLDDEALFYLRSRGIPLPAARAMLIEAFVDDITDRISIESLRAHLGALTP